MSMTINEKVELWNAIHEYVIACGGNPDDTRYARRRREDAVVAVESVVERLAKGKDPK